MRNVAVVLAFAVTVSTATSASQPVDPFAFFGPSVVLSGADRERLSRGEPVVRTLPARGHSVAVFAAVQVAIGADRLLAWIRDIEAFKRGPLVQQVGRFSSPPRIDDIASLTFPPGDFADLRQCQRSKCDLKLTAEEIDEAKAHLSVQSPAIQQDVLRQLLLRRVERYLSEGAEGPGNFGALVDESRFLREQAPDLARHIEQWRATNGDGPETFVYWAKEHYGGKPIVGAMQVFVLPARGGCVEALIVSKQLFASHYVDAWLGVTALVRDPATDQAYFVYIVRASVDVLRGFWGGLVRHVLQRRLKSEGVALVDGMRRRLERGWPPSMTTAPLTTPR